MSRMKQNEFEKLLFPDDWMSPAFVVERFNLSIQKYGANLVLGDSRFKRAREMWITAVSLLGLQSISEKVFWLKPEYNEQAPDTYGTFFTPHATIQDTDSQVLMPIEVTEWEGHSEDGLVQRIIKKLHN